MQKKKLDLNNLLAKYEGLSGGTQSRFQEPAREPAIEEEFYQYKTYQQQSEQRRQHREQRNEAEWTQTQGSKGNFIMSKSEVEQFLLSVREDLRAESKGIAQHSDSAIRQIHENFTRSHQKLKREILDLLDRTFYENEKNIKDELAKQSKIDPPEFVAAHKKISALDEDIIRLLNALKGPEYRKAIAEVVTRDFQVEMGEVRSTVISAKNSFIQSLGEIEPDRTRIDNIKDNLLKLFYFSKKNNPTVSMRTPPPPPEQSGIFSIFKDKTQLSEQPPLAQQQSRTRKSFFNFGAD